MYFDILAQLLDCHTRSKLLKLFYRNQNRQYTLKEVVKKTQSKSSQVKSELKRLGSIHIVKSSKRKGVWYFYINKDFHYHQNMEKFVSELGKTPMEQLTRLVKNLGSIKLAYATGVFVKYGSSKIDLFMVGEDVSKAKLSNLLTRLEAETGKEIDYSLIDTKEYEYRKGMFDRFVLELEEKPHKILIDKISTGKSLK